MQSNVMIATVFWPVFVYKNLFPIACSAKKEKKKCKQSEFK